MVDNFRERARAVRDLPLEVVLVLRGAVRDRSDRFKWHTERGPLSVSRDQFMNWQQECGGGGAIDLVMHLVGVDCREAVIWLEQHAGGSHPAPAEHRGRQQPRNSVAKAAKRLLQLPVRDDRMLARVHEYLAACRHLAPSLLEKLVACGRMYADGHGNAVFVLVAGKPHRPVGAEMRGTGPRAWRGMAAGSAKDAGFFWIGPEGSQQIVLCESAIDAISCSQMHPEWICISTTGVRANPGWLRTLVARGYQLHCGFDTDTAGETAAARMIAIYPSVHRLRPPAHDWNDALALRG